MGRDLWPFCFPGLAAFCGCEGVDYAVADTLLTRGEGSISEAQFARSIEDGSPGPEDYLMVKYRRLAVTVRPPVKTAACVLLSMWGHDVPISDGSPDCRPAR